MAEELEVKQRPEKFHSEIKSKPVVEKKTALRRITESLIEDDLQTIKDRVIEDVIIPSVKEGIGTILHNAISIIFGGSNRPYGSVPTSSGRVIERVDRVIHDYTASSKKKNNYDYDTTPRRANPYNLQTLKWRSFDDAKYVLNTMRSIIKQYDSVSINDMYDIGDPEHMAISPKDIPPEACNWGWVNLNNAEVMPDRGGYYSLKLPAPVSLK